MIVVQSPSCVWLCNPMDCSTPGLPGPPNISYLFISVICVMVISPLWCYSNCFGLPWTSSISDSKQLINTVCSDCSTVPPSLFLSSGLPIPWDTTILKLDRSITLQWPVSVHVKGRAIHLSPEIKTQKLLNLVRETETEPEPSLLYRMSSWECKGKVLEKN